VKADFYVAPWGDDGNPGTEDKPFATLKRARDAVRELKERVKKQIIIFVRGGTYYLLEPLVFKPEDSGADGRPVTYAAYPGERPVISGGVKIKADWESFRDGIVRCSLPEVKKGKLYFTQLFINGKRQIRARYPNYDPENPLVHGKGYINAKDGLSEDTDFPHPSPKGLIFDPETFTKNRWAKPNEAIIHVFPATYWGILQWEIKDIDWDNNIIWFGKGGFQIRLRCRINRESRFFVENVFEELDAPGEWYLDKEEGMLYYMPYKGVDLSESDVIAPILKQVVEFRGSQEEPVSNITLSGFKITHTASIFLEPYEAPSLGDWTIHRSGAVFMEGAVNCTIENFFFDAVGGNGVFINNYNRGIKVAGCKFTESGESAICLVGSRHLSYGSVTAFPSDCTISNNLIHDCGIFGKQIAGVFISNSKRITVSHNLIYNMPRAGICINDGWGGGHIIEYNEVYNAVRETRDHGPFNSWGREWYWCVTQSHNPKFNSPHPIYIHPAKEKTIIRNNYFHGVEGYIWGDYRQAIDLDDGSSNFHVYNNLCVGMAIGIREGDYRIVENNIIINPVVPTGFHVGYDNNHDIFRRNIIVTTGDIYILNWPPPTTPWLDIDYNIFFNPQKPWLYRPCITVGSRDGSLRKYTLTEWQDLGYDKHSIFADPMFINPDKGDYRVKPESPALKLGFKNFDMNNFGLLPDFPEQWLNEQEKHFIKYGK